LRHRNTLLLAAAELGRGSSFKTFQLDERKDPGNTFFDLVFRRVPVLKRKGHVVKHIHVGPYGVGLKNHAKAPLFRRHEDVLFLRPDDLVPDDDLTGIGGLQPHDTPQQCCFPAAAWSQQGEDVIGGDGEVYIIQGPDPFALGIVVPCHALDLYFHKAST
jgi:hypothetical protein